ncbi:MAG TPA: hypothetical protein EYQ50_06200 [Verrucomicrobiales bacterium]|nr:hypothetical protein [Verrucomicrobiales bacterium]HIL70539.1 hypothetical protein [Verrucomicrobiota bacterium]
MRITEREGLPDDKVRTLLEDSHQNLWIGTWSGLCRTHPSQRASSASSDRENMGGQRRFHAW